MSLIKVLFFGTSDFSKNSLQNISDTFQIQAVVTKPDVPTGRKLKVSPSAVKEWALERGIPVYTPQSLKDPRSLEFSQKLDIDIVLVISYGLMIPDYFLNQFPNRVLNVHTSLLPRWRGAAPVPHSLLAGDEETGVTLQKMVSEMDAGDIIHQVRFPILPQMNSVDIYKKMEDETSKMLPEILPLYLKGKIKPTPQDESQVTFAPKIQKSQLRINWKLSATEVFNSIRAYVSEGGMYTYCHKMRIKVFSSEISSGKGAVGQILGYDKDKGLLIACGQNAIYLKEVQREGKKRQSIVEFMKGFSIEGKQFE